MKQYHHQPNPDDDDDAAATPLCRRYITAHQPSLQTRVGGVVDYNRVRDDTTTAPHTPPSLQRRVGGVVFIYFTTIGLAMQKRLKPLF
jgi:hypothetical protein